ncbi:hypothetical protein ABS71_03695 [bacterium SCN 62-11]|nr:MAG: hypothetical protein ABS71_03695 [bacterium SCN 62-11]
MNIPTDPQPPSLAALTRATVVAALTALLLLITVVLPAEYGVDPTGLGRRIGLQQMRTRPATPAAPAIPPATNGPVIRRDGPYRKDELTLMLLPGKGAEIKATMKKGDQFLFNWTADAPVDFDMHGDEINAPKDVFTSYWKDEQKDSGHGSLVAPFEGIHGWYWVNKTSRPVTIHVTTCGFYEKLARI